MAVWHAVAQPLPRYTVISIPTRVTEAGKQMLAADLYANDGARPKPVILIQTPYNRKLMRLRMTSATGGGSVPFDTAWYNYVILDWRGFYDSKDADVAGYDRGLDGFDAVEWIAAQPWCNGKVATWGGSALGMIQFQTARYKPPHLVCCAPFIKDFKTKYTDYFCGGVYRTEHVASLAKLGFGTNLALQHQTHDNAWKMVENLADFPGEFAVPMFLVSGWYDHFPADVIRAFTDIQSRSDKAVRAAHKLMMGPWSHGALGEREQGVLEFPGAEGMPVQAGRRFLDYHLLGAKNGWPLEPTVRWFSMGDNLWHEDPTWPPAGLETHTLYLRRGHELLPQPEPPIMPPGDIPPDTIVADPRNPSPTVGGSRFDPFSPGIPIGPQDMRVDVESRGDVLLYSTPVFTRPEALIQAHLSVYVSSTARDADVSVRLCDVHPDGRSIILTQGIRRMRFHDSYEKETLVPPGTVVPLDIDLPPTPVMFAPGHRLRIILSGANAPMFDVNLQNGGPMVVEGDTVTAVNLIHHTASQPSRLEYTSTTVTPVDAVAAPAGLSVQVYPNPCRTQATVVIASNAPERIRVIMFDALGRVVRGPAIATQPGDTALSIDTGGLAPGLYHLRCDSGTRHAMRTLVVLP